LNNQKKIANNINLLKNELWNIDEQKLKSMKIEKEKTIENYKNIKCEYFVVSTEIFSIFLDNTLSFLDKNNIQTISTQPKDLESSNIYINTLIDVGKDINQKIKENEFKIQTTQKEQEMKTKNMIEKIQNDKKNIEKDLQNFIINYKDIQDQILEIKKQIWNLDQTISSQETFFCQKIDWNCPFVRDINKQAFVWLDNQKNILQKNLEILQKKANDLDFENKKKDLENKISDLNFQFNLKEDVFIWKSDINIDDSNQITIIENENRKLYETINVIRTFLSDIDFKLWQQKLQDMNLLRNNIDNIDNDIRNEEKKSENIENIKKQISEMEGQNINIVEQNINLEKEVDKLSDNIFYQIKIKQELYDPNWENIKKHSMEILKIIENINNLISENKSKQLEIKQIWEELGRVSDLYDIFNQDLLLIAIQQNISILTQYLNWYLGFVVDYQIDMQITQNTDSKWEIEMEFEIVINDKNGKREIKSLSGGQKVILKLAWMMAICSMTKSKMLRMDETINNLDPDTISSVTEMLEDFIKQRNLKFIVVTHSEQIQQMTIWDRLVEL